VESGDLGERSRGDLQRSRRLTDGYEMSTEPAASLDGNGRAERPAVAVVDGALRVGESAVALGSRNAEVLGAYAAAVRVERGLGADEPFALRHRDIAALADILDIDDAQLERDLMAVMGLSSDDAAGARQRLLRRRVAVTVSGVALAAAGLISGARLLGTGVAEPASAATPATTTVLAPTTTSTSTAQWTATSTTSASTTSATTVVPPTTTTAASPTTVAPSTTSTTVPAESDVPESDVPESVVPEVVVPEITPEPVVIVAPEIGESVVIEPAAPPAA
jgi:hypothetical protein